MRTVIITLCLLCFLSSPSIAEEGSNKSEKIVAPSIPIDPAILKMYEDRDKSIVPIPMEKAIGMTMEEFRNIPRREITDGEIEERMQEVKMEANPKNKAGDEAEASNNLPGIKPTLPNVPVYVLNYSSKSISVIDGEKDELYSTLPLDGAADTFFVGPDGTLIVPQREKSDIMKSKIVLSSPKGGGKIGELNLNYMPFDGEIRDDGIGVLAHTNIIGGKMYPLTVVDIKMNKEVATFQLPGIAGGMVFRGSQLLVYVGAPSSGISDPGIYLIDVEKLSVEKQISLTDEQRSRKMIFYNDKAYGISSIHGVNGDRRLDQALWVIDLVSKRVYKAAKLAKENPYNIAAVGDRLYITHYDVGSTTKPGNWVSVIDINSYETIDTVEVGKGPAGICYSRKLGKVYTANARDNSVSVIDTATNKVIKTIHTGQQLPRVIRCPY